MKNLLRYLAFVLMVGSAYAQGIPQRASTELISDCFLLFSKSINGRLAYWDISGFRNRAFAIGVPSSGGQVCQYQFGGALRYSNDEIKELAITECNKRMPTGSGCVLYARNNEIIYDKESHNRQLNQNNTKEQANAANQMVATATQQTNISTSNLPACQGKVPANWNQCYGSTEPHRGGNKYSGEFINGKYSGQGTFYFANGNNYIGEFKNSYFNGQGTLYAPNGSIIYQGFWVDDKFVQSEPAQQEIAVNQTVPTVVQPYDISKSNLPACRPLTYIHDCIGTFTTPSGEQYVGEFRYSLYDGQGTLTYADGNKFVGWFKAGKYFGQGTLFAANGTVISQGIWVDGKFVQSAPAQQASVANQTVPAVVLQPDNSERDRLAAEVQAERKKRQELEEQLRVAQQATQPNKQSITSGIERRVALVIGNSTYRVSPLDNPANDATDITNALNKVGFRTTLIRNATLGQMRDATRKFAEQLKSADVALIYFAGHGIESNRKNYMIPVNADLKFEYELTDQAYDAGSWLEMLETIKSSNSERVNIVILDACRNNNLIGSRSLGSGLGRMDAPTGTFLSYSTAPGKVAADGSKGQRNSPFTRHLLNVIQQPGLQIEEAFKEVRRNVSRDTNGAQVPWESTSLVGKFYFTVQR